MVFRSHRNTISLKFVTYQIWYTCTIFDERGFEGEEFFSTKNCFHNLGFTGGELVSTDNRKKKMRAEELEAS